MAVYSRITTDPSIPAVPRRSGEGCFLSVCCEAGGFAINSSVVGGGDGGGGVGVGVGGMAFDGVGGFRMIIVFFLCTC